MRTLIAILLTFTLGLSAQAKFRANSQLNIRMADLSNYTVTFNNTTYFATEWVKIYNVPPGKHYLRIEESVQAMGRGMRANGRRLIYQGWITVPSASIVNSRVNYNRNFMLAGIIKCGNGYAYGHDRPRAAYEQGGYYGNGYPQGGPGQYQQGGYPQGGQYQGPQGNQGYDGQYDEQDYGYDGPNTYDYGTGSAPAPGPDPNDGSYDDGTYGTSKLQAKPNTTAKPAVKTQATKSNK